MTCQELVELVTDYLEGAMAPEEVVRFEEHLAVCPGCDTYVEQMRSTIAVTQAAGGSVDPSAVEPLLDAFRDFRRDPRRS